MYVYLRVRICVCARACVYVCLFHSLFVVVGGDGGLCSLVLLYVYMCVRVCVFIFGAVLFLFTLSFVLLKICLNVFYRQDTL